MDSHQKDTHFAVRWGTLKLLAGQGSPVIVIPLQAVFNGQMVHFSDTRLNLCPGLQPSERVAWILVCYLFIIVKVIQGEIMPFVSL